LSASRPREGLRPTDATKYSRFPCILRSGPGITDTKGVVMIESLALLRAQLLRAQQLRAQQLRATPTEQSSIDNYEFDEDDPRKLRRLSLQQQKKRAKELLREWQVNPTHSEKKPQLNEAQHKIATGYGFKNWSELKAHIEQAQIARDALAKGEPTALDGEQRTLHIRCGNDIKHAMAVAGFSGDFLMFPDPYVHGPVPETATLEEFIRIRAEFITSNFKLQYEKVIKGITQEYADLDKARDYDVVCLWSEHDSYDQLLVAKILDYFSDKTTRPAVFKAINITHFPGVKTFNGIGQLPPESMRVLWDMFTDVTSAQLAIGKQAWAAIRSSTPQALQELIATGTPELPTLAIALARHLKQLPSTSNGLNLTESLTLQILKDKGEINAAHLFGWYTNHYEPLTFMGDTGYWHVLEDLAAAEHAAITLKKQGEQPKEWLVALTPTGNELLLNKADWLKLNNIDRWVGGIHINTSKGKTFRVE